MSQQVLVSPNVPKRIMASALSNGVTLVRLGYVAKFLLCLKWDR